MPTPLRCDPKLFEKDLSGQVIIITGANSGIGFETAKQLGSQKATIVLACRSESKAKKAMEDLAMPEQTVFMPLDLSDLDSVRAFAKTFEEKYDRLDVLVNNAGIMMTPFEKTKQGFESQIGCNHLAHFLLFTLLQPILLKTAETTGKPSRFVAVSSCAAALMNGAKLADIDFEDMMCETKKYDRGVAYCQSKLANYLCAYEASKKYDASKLISVSLHPGYVTSSCMLSVSLSLLSLFSLCHCLFRINNIISWVRSNLDQHVLSAGFFGNAVRKVFSWSGHMIEPIDGAQTTLHCVLDDDIKSGAWYSQFGIYKEKAAKNGGWPMEKIPNENVTDEMSTKLWEVSEKLVAEA